LNRLEAVCESSHLLVEPFFDGSLIATSNGMLLLDNWTGMMTQYTHDEIRY